MPSSRKLIFYFIAAAVLLGIAASQITPLALARSASRLNSRASLAGVPPAYALADGLLGGFRGFLITILWQRAENKKNARQYYEMVDLYKIIGALEPNFPNSWAYMAWDLSYNVAASFTDDPRERVYWVFRGVEMLRDEAIRFNPHSARLYEQLALIFHDKFTKGVDPAFPFYRRNLALSMAEVADGGAEPPLLEAIIAAEQQYGDWRAFLELPAVKNLQADFTRLNLGDLLTAAYAIARDNPETARPLTADKTQSALIKDAARLNIGKLLRERFNLDPNVMLELDRRFTPLDWRLGAAHSLYWAWLGQRENLAANPADDSERFVRMIYLSLIQLAYQNAGTVTDDGLVIAAPNPAMTDAIIAYLEEIIAENSRAVTQGTRAVLENFLVNTIFNYYFADDLINAERMRQRLIAASKNESRYGGALAKFVRSELPAFLGALDDKARMLVMISFCNRAYKYLIAGDLAKYQEQNAAFESNYARVAENWRTRVREIFSADESFGIPAIDDLRAELAAQIIAGEQAYNDKEIAIFRRAMQQYYPQILARAEQIAAAKKSSPGL